MQDTGASRRHTCARRVRAELDRESCVGITGLDGSLAWGSWSGRVARGRRLRARRRRRGADPAPESAMTSRIVSIVLRRPVDDEARAVAVTTPTVARAAASLPRRQRRYRRGTIARDGARGGRVATTWPPRDDDASNHSLSASRGCDSNSSESRRNGDGASSWSRASGENVGGLIVAQLWIWEMAGPLTRCFCPGESCRSGGSALPEPPA